MQSAPLYRWLDLADLAPFFPADYTSQRHAGRQACPERNTDSTGAPLPLRLLRRLLLLGAAGGAACEPRSNGPRLLNGRLHCCVLCRRGLLRGMRRRLLVAARRRAAVAPAPGAAKALLLALQVEGLLGDGHGRRGHCRLGTEVLGQHDLRLGLQVTWQEGRGSRVRNLGVRNHTGMGKHAWQQQMQGQQDVEKRRRLSCCARVSPAGAATHPHACRKTQTRTGSFGCRPAACRLHRPTGTPPEPQP